MNYVYANLRNPLSIVTDHRIRNVSTDNGNIFSTAYGYVLVPARVGKCVVTVSGQRSTAFELNVIPVDSSKVYAMLGPKGHGNQNGLQDYRYLRPVWDVDFEVNSKILEFSVEVEEDNVVAERHENPGFEFDEVTLRMIRTAKPPAMVIFNDIVLSFENGNTMSLRPIIIKLN
jgi:hypothetical protein